jgi:hypothetical protein
MKHNLLLWEKNTNVWGPEVKTRDTKTDEVREE